MSHNKPHTQEAKNKISKAKKGMPLIAKRRKPKNIGGIRYWLCPACKRLLPETSYYKSKRTWNGITSQCRNCHIRGSIRTRDTENSKRLGRESMRRQRKINPEKFRAREREYSKNGRPKDIRYYARLCLNNALRGGIIQKPKVCEKCNKEKKLTGHHEDYMKPLEVEWLCYGCHGNK